MTPFWESLTTIATAITGVAVVAVLVSRNANTSSVLQAGASGFSNMLDVAISPVSGKGTAPNLSYPGGGGSGSFQLTPSSINGGFSF